MDLTNIYRLFYPIATEYTFFSLAHRTFSKIDHILGHKASVKCKKIEISLLYFIRQYGVKLETSNEKL
jgi:hypothetical protein